jgi:hypothetical protein
MLGSRHLGASRSTPRISGWHDHHLGSCGDHRHAQGQWLPRASRALGTEEIGFVNRDEGFKTDKNSLAFEQGQMRKRWSRRSQNIRVALPSRLTTSTVTETCPRKALMPAKSVKAAPGAKQYQDSLALGFSLGVPPIRAGYSTATIEYSCVCGVFSVNPNECPRCGRKRQIRT